MEELLGAMRGSLEAHVCCGMWGEHGTRQCGTSSQIPNLQQSSLNYLLLLELVQPFTFFFSLVICLSVWNMEAIVFLLRGVL